MRRRTATLAALAAIAAVVVAILVLWSDSDSKHSQASDAVVPGQPAVEIVSPRNGARQTSHAVVVKALVHNFRLAPRAFGGD